MEIYILMNLRPSHIYFDKISRNESSFQLLLKIMVRIYSKKFDIYKT